MNLLKIRGGMRTLLVAAAVAAAPAAMHAQRITEQQLPGQLVGSELAVGSWFGRAIPKNTICTPGAAGCAAPSEIIMAFTIMGDGNFIGIDSNIFKGGTHTTAHGQWVSRSYGTVHATFTLLQESATAPGATPVFIGGFKNIFDATLSDANNMTGQIDAYLYLYTDSNGNSIVDPATGLPTPSPLSLPAQCDPTKGCIHLGTFSFIAKRVEVEN